MALSPDLSLNPAIELDFALKLIKILTPARVPVCRYHSHFCCAKSSGREKEANPPFVRGRAGGGDPDTGKTVATSSTFLSLSSPAAACFTEPVRHRDGRRRQQDSLQSQDLPYTAEPQLRTHPTLQPKLSSHANPFDVNSTFSTSSFFFILV